MNRSNLRPIIQINVMLAVIGIAAITGWGCICGSSDSKNGPELSRDRRAGPDLLMRWNDLKADTLSANAKDMAYLKEWLGNGDVGVGLLIPQAPGASQPGDIVGNPKVDVQYWIGGQFNYFTVPMTTSQTLAEKLEQASPAPQGAHWQALVPSSFDWLSQVPTQTATFNSPFSSLAYTIDFYDPDLCNHCQVKLTGCSTRDFSPAELAVLRLLAPAALSGAPEIHAGEYTCSPLVNSTILLHDFSGPVPGPLTLNLGIFGLSPYTATVSNTISLPIDVSHTSVATMSVDLEPIRSERGWHYTWTKPDGTPVTQVDVDPLVYPYAPNVRIYATGLPDCTRLLDTLYMTATAVLTPSLTATASTSIQLLPDPARCATADVGIFQVASSSAISAGLPVTLTWTITNFESSPVSVAISGTLSPPQAVGGVVPAPGCSLSGALITCQVDLAAAGSQQLSNVVRSASTFNGQILSLAQVEPVGAGDARFYDNSSGPAHITVSGGLTQRSQFLPMMVHWR